MSDRYHPSNHLVLTGFTSFGSTAGAGVVLGTGAAVFAFVREPELSSFLVFGVISAFECIGAGLARFSSTDPSICEASLLDRLAEVSTFLFSEAAGTLVELPLRAGDLEGPP
jgi:hypothetical protein